jgi:hypothetical protein
VQTIVVAASRPLPTSDFEIAAGVAVVVALIAWKLMAGVRHRRHQPHA